MTFDQAIQFILDYEGGYVNDPLDPGGETNFGLSKRSYPDLDIKALTQDQAIEIYRRDFWERLKIEMMPERIRLPFFDCAINQGPGFATISLQRIAGTKPDAVIGYITLAALEQGDAEKFRRDFLIRRMRGYIEAGGWNRFGPAWSMRLLKVALS